MMSAELELRRQVRQEEFKVSQDEPHRIPRMKRHESIEWSEEGALVFQRPRHVHHSAKPFFEGADVDWSGSCDLLGPIDNPLCPSFRDTQLVGSMPKLEPYQVTTSLPEVLPPS